MRLRATEYMRIVIMLAGFAAVLAGCQREERELRLDPPLAAALDRVALMPNGISGAPPQVYFELGKPYSYGDCTHYVDASASNCHGGGSYRSPYRGHP